MAIYYTLLVRNTPSEPWLIEFGDYDREIVAEEREEYNEKGMITKIIATGEWQSNITDAVEELNLKRKDTKPMTNSISEFARVEAEKKSTTLDNQGFDTGVSGHSTLSSGETYVIFALDDDLEIREHYGTHEPLPIKRLKGCYKGEEETSYICSWHTWNHHVRHWLAIQFQESFLVLNPARRDNVRPACLMYQNGKLPENVGYFHSVPEHVAKRCDAWTFDEVSGCYYVCEHNPPSRVIR
tara:strand:- start:8357 stop:9076 length:720 start_codon:yes stop_codon:yes gene_type:complete